MALAYIDPSPEKLRYRVNELQRALRQLLNNVPGAATCPSANSNVVVYTDREWNRLCAATRRAEKVLKGA